MPEQITSLRFAQHHLADKVSNISQVGGIETSVIDNGYGRGTRIAWINTGSGLRYKIVIDRAMDVAETFFNQYGIAWISPAGVTSPQPFSDRNVDWLRTFAGGLFTTCGLSHVGGPEKDEYGERGLHGLISNTPAMITSIEQPDIRTGNYRMSITGAVTESRIFGPYLVMKRTISSELGESYLHIHDEITNQGNTSVPHMLLYHFNFGWPLVDEGARLIYNGAMHYVNEARDRHIFNDNNDFRSCPAPMKDHAGAGEAAAYFDIEEADDGMCHCGIFNDRIHLGVRLVFAKRQLPWLTNWQHWAPGEYVTGLEPGTHPPVGQSTARKDGTLLFIEPGETRTYDIRFEIYQSHQSVTK